MSAQLRPVFFNRVRNELFKYLMSEKLRDWDSNIVISIVNEAMNANVNNINNYLREYEVMLLNMDEHVSAVINNILLPYLNQKRVQ